ncbi:MAG TPA: hypothetical protein VNT75_07860 [Symbiobacteriaceae bacterium]|nr:hypothetical protein [Symbiobacteriaceae bacterium]
MPGPLPPGEQIPVSFHAGSPLTELDLNQLQHTLLWRILNHNHSGADGVKLGSNALLDGAVGTAQIAMHAVTRDRLGPAAVGPSELGPQAVQATHMAQNAIHTPAIANDQVTLEKLSPEIRALLNKPTLGATSYAYVLYLDGPIIFTPLDDVPWWEWLTNKTAKRPTWKWDMTRLQDDGTLQQIDYLRNPRYLDRKKPVMEKPTAFAMEATLSRMTKSERAEATMIEMVREIGPERASVKINDDVLERKRVTLRFNPAEVEKQMDTSVKGEMLLNPGVGSNAAFAPDGHSKRFSRGTMPDADGKATIRNMMENYEIPIQIDSDRMLAQLMEVPAFIDFINGPWLMPIGYYTASSRNVSAVTRLTKNGPHRVRLTFATPYKEPNYAVTITPDASGDLTHLRVPAVLTRTKEYVELTFMPVTELSSKVSFSIAIFGDLQGA